MEFFFPATKSLSVLTNQTIQAGVSSTHPGSRPPLSASAIAVMYVSLEKYTFHETHSVECRNCPRKDHLHQEKVETEIFSDVCRLFLVLLSLSLLLEIGWCE